MPIKFFSSSNSKPFFDFVYWVCLSLALLLLIISLIQQFFHPLNFVDFIQFVALTTLTTSVVLLIGDLVGLVPMPISVRTGIISSFVLSVLGSSAAVVSHAWLGEQKLSVELQLLDEQKVKPSDGTFCAEAFVPRQSNVYSLPSGHDLGILVAAVIRNVDTDQDRALNIGGTYYLVSSSDLGDIHPLERVRSLDSWKTVRPGCPKDTEKIAADLHLRQGDLLVLTFLDEIQPHVIDDVRETKQARLFVSFTDYQNGDVALSEPVSITFH